MCCSCYMCVRGSCYHLSSRNSFKQASAYEQVSSASLYQLAQIRVFPDVASFSCLIYMDNSPPSRQNCVRQSSTSGDLQSKDIHPGDSIWSPQAPSSAPVELSPEALGDSGTWDLCFPLLKLHLKLSFVIQHSV